MRGLAKAPSAGVNRASAAGLAFFVVALLTLGLASSALAVDQTYVKTYEGETDVSVFSSEGSGNGELTHPRRVAIEASSGNVLIADRDNHRVEVFAPTAHAAAYLTQFGAGTLEEPFGVAVDQSTGDVYVSDPGKDKIFKFESDGAPTPTYSLDGSFTSPAKGSGAGQIGDFEADIAVDPTTGDLLVADPGNNRVDRFEADGTFVSSFNGSGSPDGAFTGLLDLDVAPNGDVYVVDSAGPVFVEGEEVGGGGPGICVQNNYCQGASSRVLRFDSAGVYQGAIQGLTDNSAGLVAVAPATSEVLVGKVNPQGNQKIDVYAPGGSRLIDTFSFPSSFTWFPSMAAGDGAAGRLYVVTDQEEQKNYGSLVGQVAVHVYTAASLPEAAIDPVGAVTTATAQVSGTVDPQGTTTSWRFEYRRPGSGLWLTGPSGNAGSGTGPVAVTAELTGLEPNLEYEVRLVATGAAAKDIASAPVSLTTSVAAPLAHTRFVAPRTTTTARLNGYVFARNAATTYHFEWGPTSAYGSAAPAFGEGSAGNGGDQRLVTETLTGLQPGTTYHYRLIATNAAGVSSGEDRTFTTRTAPEMTPPQRGIELVTPPDKGNQNASGFLTNQGENVVWSTMTGSPGSSQGKGSLFLAHRTPSGWVSESLLPRPQDMIGGGELGYTIQGASADYRKLIFQVGEDANWGIEGDPFYFTRFDRGTDSQQTLGFLPKGGFEVSHEDGLFFGSDDGSHFYLEIRNEPIEGSLSQLYDIGSGGRQLVSVLPETGEAPACGTLFDRQEHVMSKDGSRFYFLTRGDDCSDPVRIYLYDDHGTTERSDDTVTRVTTPPVAGPEGESRPLAISNSGDSIIYHSSSRITAEDTNDQPDLYRWTIGKGNECITCVVPDPGLQVSPYGWVDNIAISHDLSHVYISTTKQLVPGIGRTSGENLYLIDNGQVTYISPSSSDPAVSLHSGGETTPDGRVLTFVSDTAGITADDNGGLRQVYRYSQDDSSVECLSCVRGGAPTSEVREPPTRPKMLFVSPPQGSEARGLADDGDTYVFETNTALVRDDANNGPDIYEWHDGTVSLVTDGEGEYGGAISVPLTLEGLTRDGVDILFRVSARLTGYEHDDVGQLFVSRAGGGFPPPQSPAVCNEDACQGPLEGAPSFTQPGSGLLNGAGDAVEPKQARKRKARCGRARSAKAAAKRKARCAKPKKQRAGHKAGKNRSGK